MSQVEKFADLAVSNLTSGGGKLQDDQADTFFRKVFDRPGLVGDLRSIQMNSDTMNINKIGLGSRIIRVAPTGTPPYMADDGTNDRNLAATDRFNPTFEQVQLTVKEYMAEIHITDDIMENNLEKENIENVILDMASRRLALDIEELLIIGDTANGALAPELRLQDGIMKRVVTNVVDHGNAAINLDAFANLQYALPTKHSRNLPNMKYYLHNYKELAWRQGLAARGTALGDNTLVGDRAVPALGIPLAPVPTMPTTQMLFTDPKNIVVGIQRNMRLEYERYPRSRMNAFIFTLKIGVQLEEEDSTVKLINLG